MGRLPYSVTGGQLLNLDSGDSVRTHTQPSPAGTPAGERATTIPSAQVCVGASVVGCVEKSVRRAAVSRNFTYDTYVLASLFPFSELSRGVQGGGASPRRTRGAVEG